MRVVSFSQLRNNAKAFFDAVEKGETLEVSRRGKTIAEIRPVRNGPDPRWLNRPKGIKLKSGASISDMIIQQRREAKY